MSKPMRIDDHANWIGGKSKESPLPMQSKMKQYTSANGAGSEIEYEETSEDIKMHQEKNDAQVKKHPMKPHHRN